MTTIHQPQVEEEWSFILPQDCSSVLVLLSHLMEILLELKLIDVRLAQLTVFFYINRFLVKCSYITITISSDPVFRTGMNKTAAVACIRFLIRLTATMF
ncbi:hypothetical protein I7I48_08196 [Histoplasma ohiense]|nr:hypothetical protein I7I48_08196 [Histoplasma ohiense (nom. inval.)]